MARRPQFSLRILLAAIAAISLGLAAVMPEPTWITWFLMIASLFAAAAISAVGIWFGGGAVRAFCIGAALPAVVGVFFVAALFTHGMHYPLSAFNPLTPDAWSGIAPLIRPTVANLLAMTLVSGVAGWLAYLVIGSTEGA